MNTNMKIIVFNEINKECSLNYIYKMLMFILENLEVMFYKYKIAIQLDFKIRDVANKHLKFRGKVSPGDTKLDCCSLIY